MIHGMICNPTSENGIIQLDMTVSHLHDTHALVEVINHELARQKSVAMMEIFSARDPEKYRAEEMGSFGPNRRKMATGGLVIARDWLTPVDEQCRTIFDIPCKMFFDPEPRVIAGDECPECGGKGKITLLTSTVPCKRCKPC